VEFLTKNEKELHRAKTFVSTFDLFFHVSNFPSPHTIYNTSQVESDIWNGFTLAHIMLVVLLGSLSLGTLHNNEHNW